MDLEEEVATLRARVERLEVTIDHLMEKVPPTALDTQAEPFDNISLRTWLRARGVTSEPSQAERDGAERWHALPEEEKRQNPGRAGSAARRSNGERHRD